MKLSEYIAERVRAFPGPVRALDYLFDGPAFTSDEIFGIYGMPQAGKTLFSLQTAYFLTYNGFNVLYIDTEGSIASFARAWIPQFKERYGPLPEGRDIEVEVRKGLENLLEFLGYKGPRIIVKGDKYEFHVEDVIHPSPVEEVILEKKIDFIVLDSITAPLRVFPSRQQNYPSRADATAAIMSRLEYLQGKYNIGVLTTHHAGRNPANPYDIWENMVGGTVIRYYIKRLVLLKPSGGKQNPDIRKFWLLRGEQEKMFGRVSIARITPTGYEDVPEGEWYKYLTNSELKMAVNIEPPPGKGGRRARR